MIRNLFYLFFFISLIEITRSQEIEGTFDINESILDCEILNNSNKNVFVVGLNRSIQNAKFYGRDGNKIQVIGKAEPYSFLQASKEWTYLRKTNPDHIDLGSIYRLIIPKANLPAPKDINNIEFLVVEVTIRIIEDEKIIGEEKTIDIKLIAKKTPK